MTDPRKPSEEYVVIRNRPGYRVRRTLILLGFSIAAAVIGYAAGMAQGGFRFSTVEKSRDQLSVQTEQLHGQNRKISQQIVNLERGRAVDEQALNEARRTIVELETLSTSLQSELVFFKNIMAPSKNSRGLQVDRFTIRKADASGAYDFLAVLVQRGDNDSYLSGSAKVNIVGLRNEQRQIIALRELSDDIEKIDIKLRFRYFQEIVGRLQLPDDFEPLGVEVVAMRDGASSGAVERIFDWEKLTEK